VGDTVNLDPAGHHPAAHARATPDRAAVVMGTSGEVRTYAELDEASTRVARLLRTRGLTPGDHLAVLVDNQPEFFDVVWGGLRAGLYVTPISRHLTAGEAGYIVANCDARALVAAARLGSVVTEMGDDLAGVTTRLAVGGDLAGFERYEAAVERQSPGPVPGETEGAWMFYSSGTTGRPKGILPPLLGSALGAPSALVALLTGLYGFGPDTVYLSPGPLYHAAPAGWTTGTQRLGGTAVVMEHFDPLQLLELIERHRVTHLQVGGDHLVRLLKLPAAERDRFDLSSLQVVVHAAAPCPMEVKRAVLDWLGPIVYEFYSGSEGSGFCAIGPEEWLAHPGSVGRTLWGAVHIVGPDGEEVPVGVGGEIWFETPHRFEYHDDPATTATVWNDRGWSTLGDIGRVDDEGYLYLTDRASNMIISGGVNIYPQEVEDLLVMHPAVLDAAVVGTPDADLGEQVTAFVQLLPGAAEPEATVAAELIAYCRDRLSHVKCPRSVRIVEQLPRMPNGKLLKRLLT
jgi:acyl-CoA synthetase (AMP-forming)/AMP-acid ligase II